MVDYDLTKHTTCEGVNESAEPWACINEKSDFNVGEKVYHFLLLENIFRGYTFRIEIWFNGNFIRENILTIPEPPELEYWLWYATYQWQTFNEPGTGEIKLYCDDSLVDTKSFAVESGARGKIIGFYTTPPSEMEANQKVEIIMEIKNEGEKGELFLDVYDYDNNLVYHGKSTWDAGKQMGWGFWFTMPDKDSGIKVVVGHDSVEDDSITHDIKLKLLPPPCNCTDWVNAECVSDTERRQTRVCTPAGCDIEERIITDPTCAPVPPPPEIKFPWWSFVLAGIPAGIIKSLK